MNNRVRYLQQTLGRVPGLEAALEESYARNRWWSNRADMLLRENAELHTRVAELEAAYGGICEAMARRAREDLNERRSA